MKKVKLFLVSLLTVILSLFCLVGCTTGKYKAVSYKIGPASVDITDEDNESYVELKGDNTAIVHVKVATISVDGTGTWEEKDDKISITIEGVTYSATEKDGVLTVNFLIGSVVLKK